MTGQRYKARHVWTVAVVARDLGVGEDLMHDLTLTLTLGSNPRTV